MNQSDFFAKLAQDATNFEELVRCPWCGAADFSLWGEQSYAGFLSVECESCRVVYVRRRFNELGRKRLCDGYMAVRQDGDRAAKRAKAHDLELSIIYQCITRGTVIDVGCGGGYLLERMPADRWREKWGTELGTDAVARANEVLKTDKIFEGEVEQLDLPRGYFNLAIARGVIEHVPSPRTFLTKVASLVADEGYLFMSGPNLDSFCAQFYKDRWRLHYPEAHLFHFTVKHLSDALAEEGFVLKSEVYHYLETPYANPEKDILQVAEDIRAKQAGDMEKMSLKSPPFFGNRYCALWQKTRPS